MDEILSTLLKSDFLIFLFGIITISGAFYVLFSKNILFASFGLLVTLLGVAALYVLAGAEFIAGAQIMIYIGGILVLIVFGIMLSSSKNENLRVENLNFKLAVPVLIILLVSIFGLLSYLIFPKLDKSPLISVHKIGYNLMTANVLPLEIVGIMLLAVLIGATFIAKKNE